MSKYPRDEFDAVEENSARHGVHRSSMEPQARSLMPLMLVGVGVLCIGLLAFFLMPKMLNNTAAPAASTTAPATPGTTASATPSETPTADVEPSAAPTTAPEETPAPESVVDKSVPVAIFNAIGTSGLAGQYSSQVSGDGWIVSQADNWAGQPQNTSVIFYNGIDQQANAEALGTLLSITALVDTAELGIPLAVVLGPGA